ncbi:hypothetical protein BDY19DRAFT_483867 [Irpex rosettiformis]|uniref:Uncharacterized protein n=1 Tax=Irpex rosettiformis TaxID=378272 RepID=A0ACB8UDY4_9APHY|nr:hypothetical protein BDY19DRAFT_483867 [Irpex rosettiformis]
MAPGDSVLQILQHGHTVYPIHVASFTLITFDWMLLFSDEVQYVWRKRWQFVDYLYLISRYLPFVDTVLIFAKCFSTEVQPKGCHILEAIGGVSLGSGLLISELVLVWRTYAIWDKSRKVLRGLLATWMALLVSTAYCISADIKSTTYTVPPLHDLPSCNLLSGDRVLYAQFICLLSFELVIIVLTVIRAAEQLQDVRTGQVTRAVYRDSILFFLCLFAFSTATVWIPRDNVLKYDDSLAQLTRNVHSILCCRTILHLRQEATGDLEVL